VLILTRKRGESIDLVRRATGEVIASIVVREFLPNGIIRIGIEAGQEIAVYRDNMKSGREDDYGN